MSMHDLLQGQVALQPNKVAIVSEAGELSYTQLSILIDQCVDYFIASELKAGDRVAVLALNHPDWFIALYAAARCGVVLVPLNWRLSVDELSFVLTDSTPQLLLHDAEFEETAERLQSTHNGIQLQEFGNDNFPPKIVDTVSKNFDFDAVGNTPLLIVYTSGTTGRPKGTVLSEKALLCSAKMSHHMLNMTALDKVLNVLPLFHVGGLNIQPLPALLCGATLYLQQRFNARNAVNALIEQQITLINTVPPLLQALLDDAAWDNTKLSALRVISIGSTDVPVPLIQQVHSNNIPLIQVYGATETSPVAIYQQIEHAPIEGSIGRCGLLCEVRLINEQGNEVAVGELGEIQVKGDNILSHYWNNPVATETSLVDGWFKTGDVAHRDNDGFYWFDDRLKHVIISGGENIYPAELERVIRNLPNVNAVAVIGQPDERWGEVPVAVIEGTAAKETVLEACSVLARFKQPREIFYLDALPRNALGKVQVQQIKEELL